MFTFLNSSVLLGLLAISIPIIIHLITRQKVKKILFSSLIFLKELRTQKIRRIKIRQILLLILRTLVLLLLLLAFARPTLRGKFSTSLQSQAKTSAVIIFDNSLSMGREIDGKPVIDDAKEKIPALEELFKTGDEIYAIYADEGANPIFEGARYDFKKIMQLISKVKLSHGSSDIIMALAKAKSILMQSQNLNKEIYFVSDFQQSGFKNIQEIVSPLLENTNIKLYVIPCNEAQINNLSILSVNAANQIIEKGKLFELTVMIKNYGAYEERNKLVQLFIEGKRTAQGTVTLKPGDSQELSFKIIPDKTGLLTGSILLEDDDLLLDNRWYFTFHVPDNINVLLAGKSKDDTKFLRIAAALSPNVTVSEVNSLTSEINTISKQDVLILSNLPQLESTVSSSLLNYIEQGGALILFLGGDVDLKNYNTSLNQKMNLPAFTETVGDLENQEASFSFGRIDLDHPIFKGMFEKPPEEIESPKIFFTVKTKLSTAVNEIIKLSNGNPFLYEAKYGKGKVLIFLTAIHPQWTDLHLKAVFVPLINRSIAYMAGITEQEERKLLINQHINGTVQTKSEFMNFKIERPDGSFDKIKPSINKDSYVIDYGNTDLIGIYKLYSQETSIDRWAVNYHPEESDLTLIEDKELRRIFGEENVTFINNGSVIKDAVLNARLGRELWKYAIALVLLLLIVEMLVGREAKPVAETDYVTVHRA